MTAVAQFSATPSPPAFVAMPRDGGFVARAEATIFQAKVPNMSTVTQPWYACVPCPTCCIGTMHKRTTEKKTIEIDWTSRVPASLGWRLKSATNTLTLDDGTALPGDANDLAIAVDGQAAAMARVYPEMARTRVVVEAGVNDVDYRVTVLSVWKDCEGLEQTLQECVTVAVKDC